MHVPSLVILFCAAIVVPLLTDLVYTSPKLTGPSTHTVVINAQASFTSLLTSVQNESSRALAASVFDHIPSDDVPAKITLKRNPFVATSNRCVRAEINSRIHGHIDGYGHIINPSTGLGLSTRACEYILGTAGAVVVQDPEYIEHRCFAMDDFVGVTCLYQSSHEYYVLNPCLTWTDVASEPLAANCTALDPCAPSATSLLTTTRSISGATVRPDAITPNIYNTETLNVTLDEPFYYNDSVSHLTGMDIIVFMEFQIEVSDIGLNDAFVSLYRVQGPENDLEIVGFPALRNHYRFVSTRRGVLQLSLNRGLNITEMEFVFYNLFASDIVNITDVYMRPCTHSCPCQYKVYETRDVPVPDHCTLVGYASTEDIIVAENGILVPYFGANYTDLATNFSSATKTLVELSWSTSNGFSNTVHGYMYSAGNLLLETRVSLNQSHGVLLDHSIASVPVVGISSLLEDVIIARITLVFYSGDVSCFLPSHTQQVNLTDELHVTGAADINTAHGGAVLSITPYAEHDCPPYNLYTVKVTPAGVPVELGSTFRFTANSTVDGVYFEEPWIWNQTFFSAHEWSTIYTESVSGEPSVFNEDANSILCTNPWKSTRIASAVSTNSRPETATNTTCADEECDVCPQVIKLTPHVCTTTKPSIYAYEGSMTCVFRITEAPGNGTIDLYTTISLDSSTNAYPNTTNGTYRAVNGHTTALKLELDDWSEFEVVYTLIKRDCSFNWQQINFTTPLSNFYYRVISEPFCLSVNDIPSSSTLYIETSTINDCTVANVEFTSECAVDPTEPNALIYVPPSVNIDGQTVGGFLEQSLVSDALRVPASALAINLDFTVQKLGTCDGTTDALFWLWALTTIDVSLDKTPLYASYARWSKSVITQDTTGLSTFPTFLLAGLGSSGYTALASGSAEMREGCITDPISRVFAYDTHSRELYWGRCGYDGHPALGRTMPMLVGKRVQCSVRVFDYQGKDVFLSTLALIKEAVSCKSNYNDEFFRFTAKYTWVKTTDSLYAPCVSFPRPNC